MDGAKEGRELGAGVGGVGTILCVGAGVGGAGVGARVGRIVGCKVGFLSAQKSSIRFCCVFDVGDGVGAHTLRHPPTCISAVFVVHSPALARCSHSIRGHLSQWLSQRCASIFSGSFTHISESTKALHITSLSFLLYVGVADGTGVGAWVGTTVRDSTDQKSSALLSCFAPPQASSHPYIFIVLRCAVHIPEPAMFLHCSFVTP